MRSGVLFISALFFLIVRYINYTGYASNQRKEYCSAESIAELRSCKKADYRRENHYGR